MNNEIIRCDWAKSGKLEQEYHDDKWGKPLHDEGELFKMLILEGQQAGLSWSTILKKWDAFCEAYDNFDPKIMVKYDDKKIEELLNNPGIIRNKLKIQAAISNAKAYFKVVEKYGSLNDFLWSYVDYKPIVNKWTNQKQVPANTPLSDKISKDLKKLGFKFTGSTIIYAFMQAVGMVNDHLITCTFYKVQASKK